MNVVSKGIKYFTDHDYRSIIQMNQGKYNNLSDEDFIKLKYRLVMGRELDLRNPTLFTEKLQWLKLYDRKPIYTSMVDKYTVKSIVASIIGKEYIIPTFGVWDKFEDIEFSSLPNKFVLKCTHDSGGLIICKDKEKIDYKAAQKKVSKSLKRNYYYYGREWPYKDVKPRIIAEPLIEDTKTGELRDYKFFCFGGKVKCYKVDYDRFICHRANYFTPNGELMRLGEEVCPPDEKKIIPIPTNLNKMKKLSEMLSQGQPFLRVDFYNVDGKIYFGELTFFPYSGFGKFVYEDNDSMLGSWINLPE